MGCQNRCQVERHKQCQIQLLDMSAGWWASLEESSAFCWFGLFQDMIILKAH